MMETATGWMRPREVGVDFWLGNSCTDHVRRVECGLWSLDRDTTS